MKFSPRLFLLLLLGVAGALVFTLVSRPNAATAQQPATLQLPNVACEGDFASVTFLWTPVAGAQTHWVDISTHDNGFQPDTFLNAEAGPGGSLTWHGILTWTPHVWRVNALTSSGWVTSATGAFVPCGAPFPLWSPAECQDRYTGRVFFRWAPMTPIPQAQFLDFGWDPFFSPGSFSGVSVLTNQGSAVVPNLPANSVHYFRVNSLGYDGNWYTSPTGSFIAACVPANEFGETPLGDRLVIPAAGVDAEIRSIKVDGSGGMANPNGYFHAAWYDFSSFGSLGGYANSGNMVMAGHVDCGTCYGGGSGTAVFWFVRELQPGDTAQVYTADGRVFNYYVTYSQDFAPQTDFTDIVHSWFADMTLITCVGTFSAGDYSSRRVVAFKRY